MTSLKRLSVLMATVFVDMVGFLMVLPLLPFYAEHLGASPIVIGLLISSFSFAQLATAPLWGRLSDRYGRRPVLLFGLSASAVAYVLFGLATSLWLLFLSRLAQGAGGGTTGVAQAYVSDSVGPEERAKALGWLSAATSAGVMIGPAISSLSAYLSPAAPGFIAAGLCVINVLFAWRWLPESAPTAERQKAVATGRTRPSLLRSILAVLRRPTAPVSALIWIYALGMLAFMATNGVLALYLGARFGVTEKTIGWFYVYVGGISLVMRAVLLGPLIQRLGELRVLRLGALSLAAGLIGLPFAGHLAWLALAVLFIPVGTALLFPATTSLVSRRARRAETGQVLGVQQAFGGATRMVAPIWATAAFEKISHSAPFWIAGGLMLGVRLFTQTLKLEEETGGETGEEEAAPLLAGRGVG